jgi:hypothetical protein
MATLAVSSVVSRRAARDLLVVRLAAWLEIIVGASFVVALEAQSHLLSQHGALALALGAQLLQPDGQEDRG